MTKLDYEQALSELERRCTLHLAAANEIYIWKEKQLLRQRFARIEQLPKSDREQLMNDNKRWFLMFRGWCNEEGFL